MAFAQGQVAGIFSRRRRPPRASFLAACSIRYRVLHAAARLTRGGRRRYLKIQATWPWAAAITTAWHRIDTLPQAP
jgi:hypothetical protein